MALRDKQRASVPKRGLGAGLFSGGAVAMVVVCCGGHAVVLGIIGGVALGSVLSIGAGALATAVLIVAIIAVRRHHKRAACAVPPVAGASR